MKTFLPDTNISLNLSFLDSSGNPFEATGAQYRLVNSSGTELISKTTIPGFTTGSTATLTILAVHHALATGSVSESRIVELYLTNATGTIGQIETYIIEKLDPLEVPTTSFVTYAGAEAVAYTIPNLNGWKQAEREVRIAALMEAKRRIARLRFRHTRDSQDIVDPEFVATDMETIDSTDWADFPDEFKVALQKAQLVQADHMLSTDLHTEIAKHREDGLMSMSVGEASHMFRPGKPLKLSVCRAALEYLGKYITWNKRLAR